MGECRLLWSKGGDGYGGDGLGITAKENVGVVLGFCADGFNYGRAAIGRSLGKWGLCDQ